MGQLERLGKAAKKVTEVARNCKTSLSRIEQAPGCKEECIRSGTRESNIIMTGPGQNIKHLMTGTTKTRKHQLMPGAH